MIKNFIVDRIVRGNMYSNKTGELLWSVNQIQNPSLTMESETVDAVDALGTPIMSFDRSKTCTLSGESAVFDLELLAAQMGTKAVEGTRIITAFETLEVGDTATVELAHEPAAEYPVTTIYVLKDDETILASEALKVGEAVSEGVFTISGKQIKVPDTLKGGRVFVSYEYEGKATYVVNSAEEFPKAGKFVMEVLGRDVCDSETEIYAMLILPKAKLSSSTEVSFATDMTQGFELTAQKDYCSRKKELYTLVIPEE